ncbi:DUF4950 domain-containing protein [Enterococcus crotali]|uniref:DUF4950 domain-containing protein n=1 Tax=Enterococcus crotali TaxID=1453587 RepID=UPI000470F11E|nr:DUF4950 domain-containing protein [Enterococcus crotali]
MKKVLAVIIMLFVISGCKDQVSTKDLKANDWRIEAKNDDPAMILNFTDKKVSFKLDTSSIKSSASNEWEQYGEEIGKDIINQINFDADYTLKNNVMTWEKNSDKTKYTIKKDKKDLILIPDKSNSNDNKEKLILKPYNKKNISKPKKKTKKEKTKTSASSKNKEITTTSTTELHKVSLSNFIGGWGVPNSGNLFFINSDGTYSSSTATNSSLGDISFSSYPDGRLVMNTNLGELVKELDGSLSVNSQNYQYLGNLTMDQFLAQKSVVDSSPHESTPSQTSQEQYSVENQQPQSSGTSETRIKIEEIEGYFKQQKEAIISKKRNQIAQWKANGEIDWTDETIDTSMYNFTTYLGYPYEFTQKVNELTIQDIKNSIDDQFQQAYDTMIQK